ncbi:MAG: hypothetical protein Q8Q04_03780 [archaeon]|nr:hypothetical protein [archaeon]
MGSLVKKILDEQYEMFSSFENLRELLKLGLPESWRINRLLTLLNKTIDEISLEARECNSSGINGSVEFYNNIKKLKTLLIKREKQVISELEFFGYEFVYSNYGKNILEKVKGLKNPLIEDCIRERDNLLIYHKNLEKIESFLRKNPFPMNFSIKDIKKKIKALDEILEGEDSKIESFLAAKSKGETPRMELCFSSQIKYNLLAKYYEDICQESFENLGYHFLYDGNSIKEILRKV